jgi:hypothetical protein
MKLPACDFGILITALLAALTVVVTAPSQPSLAEHPLVMLTSALRH